MSAPEISVEELAAARADGSVPLFDVRQPEEYEAVHVPGARLIPLRELPERDDEVPAGEPLFSICSTGVRSARAAEHLRRLGVDAVNVAGGTKAWVEAGYPTESGPT